MPFAVTLRLDKAGGAAIRRVWAALAAGGIDDAPALGYAPHITLGIWPDGADVEALREAAAQVSAESAGLPVRLAALGVFPGDPAVLFAAPVVTPALLTCQASLLRGVAPPHPHYRAAEWVPHVTLSKDLAGASAAAEALALAAPHWAPFRCRLDRIDVLRFRPVDLLWSRMLD